MKEYKLILVVFLLGLLMIGCGRAKIYDVPAQMIEKKNVSKNDIANAIKNAGNELGWVIEDLTSDTLKGTLSLRQHVAVVTINYSDKDYSITYLGSSGLHYKNNYTIHKNYNGWILNLDNAIKVHINKI